MMGKREKNGVEVRKRRSFSLFQKISKRNTRDKLGIQKALNDEVKGQ